jgi:DNA-binding NarL/FixJ family response regulator
LPPAFHYIYIGGVMPVAEKPGAGEDAMATRVMIVDDHPAVREGLAVRISSQADMEVCGEAADVAEAMERLADARPDVVVVDIRLKTGDGLDLVRRIASHDDSIRILVWSMYPDRVYAERALRAGALGYINKEHATGDIVEAIRRVLHGEIYVCEEIAQYLLGWTASGKRAWFRSPIESLSDRQLEVFRRIGDGQSTSEIAEQLHISPHTVETHRQRIKEKLGLATTGELTQAAIRWVLEGHGRPP